MYRLIFHKIFAVRDGSEFRQNFVSYVFVFRLSKSIRSHIKVERSISNDRTGGIRKSSCSQQRERNQ